MDTSLRDRRRNRSWPDSLKREIVAATHEVGASVAAAARRRDPGRLILATISAVFTIGHVAKILGEDEECLSELSTNLFAEDGCLHVYGVGEHGVPAFTAHGIEYLQDIIRNMRAFGETPPGKPIS